MASESFSYYESSKSKDPNAPTVIFLDEFSSGMIPVAPGMVMAHGNVSLLGAKNSGYSTIGIDYHDPKREQRGYSNFAEPLNQIDADIRSGKLKGIGKGDVLSISLVNPAVSFEDTPQAIGISVTPKTLASRKTDILASLSQIAHDPQWSKEIHDRVQSVIDTNKAIERLQEDGVTVIHSAGNTKRTTFDLDFMNAEVQLSSNKPSGAADSFSVSNSLTEKGDGVLPVVLHPEIDLFDPTPVEHQKGSFEIVGTGIVFRNTSRESFIGNTRIFNREKFDLYKPLPTIQPTTPALTSQMLLPEIRLSNNAALLGWSGTGNAPSAVASVDAAAVSKPTPLKNGLEPGDMLVVGTVPGTSFSNIKYLREHYALFRQKKAEATFGKIWNWNELSATFNKNDRQ